MTSTLHPNDVKSYSPSPEQLDMLLSQSVERATSERKARLRAEAWPRDVEELLATMAAKVVALEVRVAALEAERG